MILIADSGSTKTTWSIFDNDKVQTCCTSGINPYFSDQKTIIEILKKEYPLPAETVSAVYFYGSGCTEAKRSVVVEALGNYFASDKVEVYSDLLGAARSLSQEEGIICILGTGSNSCYYDGEVIVENISPLGYVLGDEGSGADLGKKLIGDVLKNQLADVLISDFFDTYRLNAAQIIDKVYREPFPNRFLAQFTPFLLSHIADVDIQRLVEDSFSRFVVRNVLQYKKAGELPVHFTGGVAFHFRNQLENVLHRHHLRIGKVSREPMSGLIEYHRQKDLS